jgi:hypothetical protein
MNTIRLTFAMAAVLGLAANQLLVGQDKSKPTQPVEEESSRQDSDPAGNKPAPIKFSVADGQLEFAAPGDWKKIDPAVKMIEAEFSIEPIEGDSKPCRLTVMGAGGSVDANIERWLGQVRQPDGKSSRDKASIAEKEVNGLTIHMVDVAGTYIDQRGPEAPKSELANYRLLAAIIETGSHGNYFVKLYGPEKTIARHKDGFVEMVENVKLTEN